MLGLFAIQAQAATVTLSDVSSDETPADQLDATLEFVVTDSTLTLTVTNLTEDPAAFTIDQIAFNSELDLVLVLDEPTDWTLSTDESMDGFGTFDFAVTSDAVTYNIASGDSLDFVFTIYDTDGETLLTDVSDTNFTTALSTLPTGDIEALASVKFVQCVGTDCVEDDDSAYGAAVVPLPAAVWLFGSALLGLVGVARRKGKVA
jgi:hypothetical protein